MVSSLRMIPLTRDWNQWGSRLLSRTIFQKRCGAVGVIDPWESGVWGGWCSELESSSSVESWWRLLVAEEWWCVSTSGPSVQWLWLSWGKWLIPSLFAEKCLLGKFGGKIKGKLSDVSNQGNCWYWWRNYQFWKIDEEYCFGKQWMHPWYRDQVQMAWYQGSRWCYWVLQQYRDLLRLQVLQNDLFSYGKTCV